MEIFAAGLFCQKTWYECDIRVQDKKKETTVLN